MSARSPESHHVSIPMMNKLLILIMLSSSRQQLCSFRRKEPAPLPQSPSLECAIIRATDNDRRDPIIR